MSSTTGIEWTDATWNPVVGCEKVSQGCKLCYAKTLHDMRHTAHLAGKRVAPQYAMPFEKVQLMPDRLTWPLGLRRASRIFVNSVSDLFHDDVPASFIAAVFATMALAQAHTFQVLTKRPERMRLLLSSDEFLDELAMAVERIDERHIHWHGWDSHQELIQALLTDPNAWPIPNVWLGVSVENQQAADERVPLLLETPAAIRFLSCEPLLGPVDLGAYLGGICFAPGDHHTEHEFGRLCDERRIDWVIVGGESATSRQHPRPMHPAWVRALRDQCEDYEVPFLFKQWGEWAPYVDEDKFTRGGEETAQRAQTWMMPDGKSGLCWIRDDDGSWTNHTGTPPLQGDDDSLVAESLAIINRWGKKRAGRLLDGRTWDEFPQAVQP